MGQIRAASWFSLRTHDASPTKGISPQLVLVRIETQAIELTAPMMAKYRIVYRSRGETPRQLDVTVDFPDEARSLLALISWSDGDRVLAVVDDIACSFVISILNKPRLEQGSARMSLPLDFLKSELYVRQPFAVA